MPDIKFYSTRDLMELFRVSRHAIYRANLSGQLPIAYKEGTQNYYSETDVINYIKYTKNPFKIAAK